jgi:hypothetical protein
MAVTDFLEIAIGEGSCGGPWFLPVSTFDADMEAATHQAGVQSLRP